MATKRPATVVSDRARAHLCCNAQSRGYFDEHDSEAARPRLAGPDQCPGDRRNAARGVRSADQRALAGRPQGGARWRGLQVGGMFAFLFASEGEANSYLEGRFLDDPRAGARLGLELPE